MRHLFKRGLIRAEDPEPTDDGNLLFRLHINDYVFEKLSNENFDGIHTEKGYVALVKYARGKGVYYLGEDEIADLNDSDMLTEAIKQAIEAARKVSKGKPLRIIIDHVN